MMSHRIMKGRAGKINLTGVDVRDAVLRGGGVTKSLTAGDQCVLIGEDDTLDFPVPQSTFGELNCELTVNGNVRYHVTILADSERPTL